MQIHGSIHQFSKELKLLIFVFLCTLSIGFYGGITFVKHSTNGNATGIEQRYLGNENDVTASTMQFKKTEASVLTLVHNHILSLSMIFFALALLVATTSISKKWQLFLMLEPFISILFTFGGIYFLWLGHTWVKYIVLVSGVLMTLTYTASIFIVGAQLLKK